jgi:hypothetical protein
MKWTTKVAATQEGITMNYKTAIASAVLALGSATASAAITAPTGVQGSFSDVLLTNVTLAGGAYNLTGLASYVDSYNLFGSTFALPAVSFSSVSLYLGNVLTGAQAGNSFSFSNLGTGVYSLRASGSVIPGGNGNIAYIAAQLAVTPVPEPESFGLMLAGLGVMGAIARRRKSAAAAV